MGRLFIEYLPEGRKYACKECLAGCAGGHSVVHLAAVSDLLSKSFHSRHGPAYLFTNAVNVTLGNPEERDMTTGRHVVRDLFCIACGTNLGWRYELAHERREKYKEGKYILERLQLVDLEAASTAYTNATTTTTRLVSPPPPPPPVLSSSAVLRTAAVPGTVGASPTGVMAMMMMPESPAMTGTPGSIASPMSSPGQRSPNFVVLSPPPPPPPPPPQSLFHRTMGRTHHYTIEVDPFPESGTARRSIPTVRGATIEVDDVETEMPDLVESDMPDLRAFFSNWAPNTTTTTAETATASTVMDVERMVGGGTTAVGAGVTIGEGVVIGAPPSRDANANANAATPAAITDRPPYFIIDL